MDEQSTPLTPELTPECGTDRAAAAEGGAPKERVVTSVRFGQNRIEASVFIKRDANGTPLTVQYLEDVLEKNHVTTGIIREMLAKIVKSPEFEEPIVVARGRDSTKGEDAKLKFMFELHRDLTPTAKEDGTVDFKNLGAIQMV